MGVGPNADIVREAAVFQCHGVEGVQNSNNFADFLQKRPLTVLFPPKRQNKVTHELFLGYYGEPTISKSPTFFAEISCGLLSCRFPRTMAEGNDREGGAAGGKRA